MSKLQDRRKAAGLSQSKLADKVPMSVRTLQHLEAGSLDINKAAAITVWRLAVVLECQVEDLLEFPEDRASQELDSDVYPEAPPSSGYLTR